MKTILLIIGGMADIPDPMLDGKTPMEEAYMPSLQALAQRGRWGVYRPVKKGFETSRESALLSLFGYDPAKGIPTEKQLRDFFFEEEENFPSQMPASSLIIPYYSGHGIFLAESFMARGIARLAFFDTIDLYTPGRSDEVLASTMAEEAIKGIQKNELVVIFFNLPEFAALMGDPYEKKESLELIDSHIIGPVADFVWHSNEQMQMAVTSGYISSWRNRRIIDGDVPVVIYFNDGQTFTKKEFNEKTALSGTLHLPEPYSLLRTLSRFEAPEEELSY